MAKIMTGTIMGEIMIALITDLAGNLPLTKANEASVPIRVATKVVKTATWALNQREPTHLALRINSTYHFNEKSTGGNFRYWEDPKDMGITKKAGNIKNSMTLIPDAFNNSDPKFILVYSCKKCILS
jgi:hypothetical protein